MPSDRTIQTEPFNLDGEVKALPRKFVPDGNSNTHSATYSLLSGGPVYFRAIEDQSPTDSDVPIEVGDELDVIGSEDLRLVKFYCPGLAIGVVTYRGAGDHVAL